jgi:hypothetical protein
MNSLNITSVNHPVKAKLLELLDDIIAHDGFGDIRVEVRILKRKQKEVILHCGKQYRFVIDAPVNELASNSSVSGSHQ